MLKGQDSRRGRPGSRARTGGIGDNPHLAAITSHGGILDKSTGAECVSVYSPWSQVFGRSLNHKAARGSELGADSESCLADPSGLVAARYFVELRRAICFI